MCKLKLGKTLAEIADFTINFQRYTLNFQFGLNDKKKVWQNQSYIALERKRYCWEQKKIPQLALRDKRYVNLN